MRKLFGLACLLLGLIAPAAAFQAEVTFSQLPAEARQTYRLITANGPFPYAKDGSVFGNFEGRLPRQPRGYYREYTVPTPGERHRGARRIIAGGQPPVVFYYTEDHYRSFLRIRD